MFFIMTNLWLESTAKNTPECNEQDFLSDCIHLVPGKSAVEDHG